MKLFFFIILTCSLILLQGCLTTSLISTTAIVAKGFSDPRSVGRQIDDITLTLKVSGIINKNKTINKYSNINVTVYKGRILLTGQSLTFSLIKNIEQIIKNIKGVKFIYNEIRINKPINIGTALYDAWITAKIKSKIFYYNLFYLLNVKIITEDHEVFLLGFVSQKDGNLLANICSKTNGVKLVTTIFIDFD